MTSSLADKSGLWLQVNGIGHAFGRELGCRCRRCTVVTAASSTRSHVLVPCAGLDDPPSRACTSAALLAGAEGECASGAILVDCGPGVPEVMASNLDGLDRISALLLSHWHQDHVLGLNMLLEGIRRAAKRSGIPFNKIPLYCTLDTYDWVRERGGLSYECQRLLRFQEIVPGVPFTLHCGNVETSWLPVSVAHGAVKGAVIYAVSAAAKKVVFGWDIDVPSAIRPDGILTNADTVTQHLRGFQPDLMLMAANTYAAVGTGHCSYQLARNYFDIVAPKRVLLTHLSGHEDVAGTGYGLTDAEWEGLVASDGVGVARQGMVFRL